jgi:cysteinyl-tRNA synthetase
MRAYVFSDLLRRMFEYNGFSVTQVINITDVGHLTSDEDSGEDKLEKEARVEGKTAREIADFYLADFRENLTRLNVETNGTIFPRATDHITEQIDLVKTLEEKGFTYRTSDGLYFDTFKYAGYSELAGLDLEGQREGARVQANPEKKNPADFALWKFSSKNEQRQQEWDSPWGKGFPGWHLECSAMSMKYLGRHFDVHTGGIDHIPVHHTNERAQSECATGEKFVNYWLHTAFLTVDGEKMSKSLGNIYRLADLSEKGFDPLAYRFWLLSGSYRKTLNFTFEALSAAQNGFDRLIAHLRELKNLGGESREIKADWREKFLAAINDDLNTPQGLAVIWDLLRDNSVSPAEKLATIISFDQILGLDLKNKIEQELVVPEIVSQLAAEREAARQAKNYSRSDELRQEINRLGYQVDDTDEGPKIRKL